MTCGLSLLRRLKQQNYEPFGSNNAVIHFQIFQQIEGGYDNKTEDSVWDTWTRGIGEENADVSADHFNLWENDVELLKNLSISHYRMSISWTR